ncbi:hypothetical protein F5Y04DRAFT_288155 [Hypomontagnella monticulosa]|nr:hypothetical protein F5Y04DRAFT_288155 [Hypomontagnella monticulosa]
MDFWEASEPPPPRHSTHHHPRHHKLHNGKNTYGMPDDRSRPKHTRKPHGGNLTLEKSNSASRPHSRFDVVEDWLERTGTARQNPHPRSSTSQRQTCMKEVAGNSCPSRPFGATSPYNKHPRHVDLRWGPRHGLPSDNPRQSGHQSPVLDLGDPRYTRNRAAPSDSSFISGFENSTKPPDYHPDSIHQDRDDMPSAKPLREICQEPSEASSATSQVNERLKFEKRPRHKTRDDKYETKRKKQAREPERTTSQDGHRKKKRKKTEKRKHTVSSRNVVNNFTSDAVLNERITVQPHLRPGLFDNGRASKKQPISDLTFSEMDFLKHQKRNPSKPLSKSRLRERQREDREMEEVSSFFLPPRAERDGLKANPKRRGGRLTSTRRQELASPALLSHHNRPYNRILKRYQSIDDGMESGKDTTFFTWSSSGRSPRPDRQEYNSTPGATDLIRTATPKSIRRKLIATGIYRDTGITTYDDYSGEQNRRWTIERTTPNNHRVGSENNHHYLRHDFDGVKKVEYRDQAIMTDDVPRPPPNDQVTEDHQRVNSGAVSNTPAQGVTQELDRHQIARAARLIPAKNDISRQSDQAPGLSSAETTTSRANLEAAEIGVNQNIESRLRHQSEQASVTSRDRMPPPSIPRGKNSPMMMAPNAEVVSPGRRTHSTNTAPECLEVPHTMSYNVDIQNSQGTSGSNHPVASPSEPIADNERPLSSLDAVSWIPQRAPSARIVENQNIYRRPSLSPMYVDQYEGKLNGPLYLGHSRKPHVPESMAKFIARIEREAQLQSPQYDINNLVSESVPVEVVPEPPQHGMEQFNSQPLVYDRKMALNLTPDSRPRSTVDSGIDQHKEGLSVVDTKPLQYGEGVPRVLSDIIQPSEDIEEECFEMAGFWRPNQFSQF